MQEVYIKQLELADKLLGESGIKGGLNRKYENMPSQAETFLEEYKKYFKLAYEAVKQF